jgi:hypothetical protein
MSGRHCLRPKVVDFYHTELPSPSPLERSPGGMHYLPTETVDAVQIVVEFGNGERDELTAMNPQWSYGCPRLCVLAWAGLSPSESEELVGVELPVDAVGGEFWKIHDSVLEGGSRKLENECGWIGNKNE